jgi:phosphoglycolate phosphatase-like HAD superfamily hydrolase
VAGKKMDKTEMISYLINKWNLDRATTLMVGDDASDVIAAHNNGITSVAIVSGYGDVNEIQKAKPKYIIDSINNFNDIFMRQFKEVNISFE